MTIEKEMADAINKIANKLDALIRIADSLEKFVVIVKRATLGGIAITLIYFGLKIFKLI